MHILLDQEFQKTIQTGAHDSWMSSGQYIRELVGLFRGAHFDSASDWVMIGEAIGIERFEALRALAEQKGLSVGELCDTLLKNRSSGETAQADKKDADQLSLFD